MTIEITKERLEQLEDAARKLNALEVGGVDNWEFYDEAMTQYLKDVEEKEQIQRLLSNIQEALCEGIHEPSERGAGFGFTDLSSENALQVLKNGIEEIVKARTKK